MTIWDNIYKNYQQGGEAWATLKEGLIPQFISFVEKTDFSSKNVFDIGCGTGKYLAFLKAKGFKVAGIDSSETAVEMTKKNLEDGADIKCVNMFDYAIPSGSFDFIISISTIHHGMKNDVKTLIEKVHKALLPGGKVFITLPDYESASRWNTFKEHQDLGQETFAPLSGPEKGLPHSFFKEAEIRQMFAKFNNLTLELDEIGRWIITGKK